MKMLNLKVTNFFKNHCLTISILLAVILGAIVGMVMGEKSHFLLPFGTIFLNLTFTIVTPLIFFTVSSAVANIISLEITKRTIWSSLFVFIGMSFIATLFGLAVVKIFPLFGDLAPSLSPFKHMGNTDMAGNFSRIFTASDFGTMLTREAILPLIIFSIIFGAAVKLAGEKGEGIKNALNNCSTVMYKMVDLLMYYAPVGLFAYFAVFVGMSSREAFDPLYNITLNFYIVVILFGLIFYTLYAYIAAGTDGVKALKYAFVPSVIAFATKSSLATLPITMEAGKKINMPKSVCSLGLPLGSIIHLDGTSMATVVRIALLFSIFGVDMGGTQFYLYTILMATFACLFTAGIPGGGLILEVSIITIFGFPMEAMPILILLNALTDPIRTVLNVNGNIVGTMLISRIVRGKGWIYRRELEKDPVLNIYR